MADLALDLADVSAGYGRQTVLHNLSLRVPNGALVGLIGPNGHGKSTLLKTVSGMTTLSGGSVHIGGKDITGSAPHDVVSAGVTHIPQGDLVFPDMTVQDNLMMGAYLPEAYARREASVEKVFRLFPRLSERVSQVASSLSGGERRMLAIGRGLMSGGDLLMIDEPSLGLAPLVIEEIYQAIAELNAEGRSIVIVEENASRLTALASSIYLIDHGTVAWKGTAEAMLRNDELVATYFGG